MSDELIRQLKNLKQGEANPRSEWLQSNRSLLLSQIRNTVSGETEEQKFDINNVWSALAIFIPKPLVFNVIRPIAVLLIVAMVGTSGWIATVDASYESLPGDWLYPAKRAAERTQTAVTSVIGDKKAQTILHSELSNKRAKELKKVVADPSKQSKVKEAVADLKTELQAVSVKLDEIKAEPNTNSAQTVKDVKTNTEEVKKVLENVKDTLQANTTTDQNLVELAEVKNLSNDTAVQAAEVMVTKHLEGDNSVTKEEVKKELDKTLTSAATDIVENKQNVEGVKTVVEAVTTEVKEIAKDNLQCAAANAINKDGVQCAPIADATTTKELTDKMIVIAGTTKDAAVKTDAAAVEGDKKILEAKDFIVKDDLVKAMDKVRELTVVSKEAEKIKDNALADVKTMMPIINVVKDASVPVITASSSVKVEIKPVTTTASGTVKLEVIVKPEVKTSTTTKK